MKLGVNDALGTGGFTFVGGILDANNTTDSTIGALSLTADATLALHAGGGAGTLTFASATWTTGTLTITGWSGSPGGPGADDKIFITSTPNQNFLDHVQFDIGGTLYYATMGGGNELIPNATPVPEPINVALALFGVVFAGVGVARRLRARSRRPG